MVTIPGYFFSGMINQTGMTHQSDTPFLAVPSASLLVFTIDPTTFSETRSSTARAPRASAFQR